jgi:hypothetical protein
VQSISTATAKQALSRTLAVSRGIRDGVFYFRTFLKQEKVFGVIFGVRLWFFDN